MEGTPACVVLSLSRRQRPRSGHELSGTDQRQLAESAGADQLRRRSVFIEKHFERDRLVLDERLCIAASAGTDRGDVRTGVEDLLISLTDLTGPFTTGQSAEVAEKEDDPGISRPAVAEPLLGPLRIDKVHCTERGDIKRHPTSLGRSRDQRPREYLPR